MGSTKAIQFNIFLRKKIKEDNELIRKLNDIAKEMPSITTKAGFLRFILWWFVDNYKKK